MNLRNITQQKSKVQTYEFGQLRLLNDAIPFLFGQNTTKNGLDFTDVFHSPVINIVFSSLTRSNTKHKLNQSCGQELRGAAGRLLGQRVLLELYIQRFFTQKMPV